MIDSTKGNEGEKMKEIKLCKCCKSKWLAVKKVDIYDPEEA